MRQVRTTHRYGYRHGEWAEIVADDHREDGRPTWLVRFPDDDTDIWVADDTPAQDELREVDA